MANEGNIQSEPLLGSKGPRDWKLLLVAQQTEKTGIGPRTMCVCVFQIQILQLTVAASLPEALGVCCRRIGSSQRLFRRPSPGRRAPFHWKGNRFNKEIV